MDEKFKFKHEIKVRWSEIDAMNIVFNAHYLNYLELASTEYLKEGLKLDLMNLTEQDEFNFVLAKSTLEFISPARLWDNLQVWCRTKNIGNKSYTMEFIITKESEKDLVLKAEIIYACYSKNENQSVPVPSFLRQKIESFEKGIETL
ncbi:acyl-CoA thioesterase [Oceanobacillus salinisoli]|uniref:acyl-CoA thioesterase n=1 Tax=Oceanobacillus salinisoli TaxID=2678611 RepID=UPI0012E17269|nr:thioesterase family protein [Oceanobacillus salinisoli]